MYLENLMIYLKKSKKPFKNIKIRLRKICDPVEIANSKPSHIPRVGSPRDSTPCERVRLPASFSPSRDVASSSWRACGFTVPRASNPRRRVHLLRHGYNSWRSSLQASSWPRAPIIHPDRLSSPPSRDHTWPSFHGASSCLPWLESASPSTELQRDQASSSLLVIGFSTTGFLFQAGLSSTVAVVSFTVAVLVVAVKEIWRKKGRSLQWWILE